MTDPLLWVLVHPWWLLILTTAGVALAAFCSQLLSEEKADDSV